MRVSVVLAVALLPFCAPLVRAQQQPAPIGSQADVPIQSRQTDKSAEAGSASPSTMSK